MDLECFFLLFMRVELDSNESVGRIGKCYKSGWPILSDMSPS